jgi:hypothetical protein
MITTKERARRFGVRLKTLFNIPEYTEYGHKVNRARIPVKIPNLWYDPFELYVLAHIQRAHFIMTCNEWEAVNASCEYLDKQNLPKRRIDDYEYDTSIGIITYYNKNGKTFFKTLLEEKDVEYNVLAKGFREKDENTNTQTESNN